MKKRPTFQFCSQRPHPPIRDLIPEVSVNNEGMIECDIRRIPQVTVPNRHNRRHGHRQPRHRGECSKKSRLSEGKEGDRGYGGSKVQRSLKVS